MWNGGLLKFHFDIWTTDTVGEAAKGGRNKINSHVEKLKALEYTMAQHYVGISTGYSPAPRTEEEVAHESCGIGRIENTSGLFIYPERCPRDDPHHHHSKTSSSVVGPLLCSEERDA